MQFVRHFLGNLIDTYFWVYFFCINVFTLILVGIDKWKAIYALYRISHKKLVRLSLLG